jgi:hypothetical protein
MTVRHEWSELSRKFEAAFKPWLAQLKRGDIDIDVEPNTHTRLCAVVDEILKRKPTTLAELALWARAEATLHEDLWRYQDHGDAYVRTLLEGICKAAGAPAPMTAV